VTVARAGLRQRLAHGGEFRLAPHKAGEAPCSSGLEASTEGARSNQLEHLYRLRHPLDRDGSQRLHLHQALDQPQGRGGQPNCPRRGQLLHAGRQMRRLPHRRVVHVQVVTNGPHHHFAGVQSHPDTQLDAVGAAHRLGILAHGCLHGQGGVAGSQGMVLMGQGRAKEGHEAITQNLVHRALIAVHSVHHGVQDGVEELLCGFRVEVANQLGGTSDVGKQDGDLLAFAFQGAARGQDLLREIGGRVRQRGLGSRRCGPDGGWGRGRVASVQMRPCSSSRSASWWA
jgi:hypothetical protein